MNKNAVKLMYMVYYVLNGKASLVTLTAVQMITNG